MGSLRIGKANYIEKAALPFFSTFRRLFYLISFLLAASFIAYPAEEQLVPFPAITRLDSRDTVFRQYISEVEAARRALYSSRRFNQEEDVIERLLSSMTIYSYIPGERDDLFSIAARCNIPYATLASLNRFSHSDDVEIGKELFLPSVPGIFVPQAPGTGLERLLFITRSDQQDGLIVTIPGKGEPERFRFIPGDDFTATERIFFFDRGFQFPLQNYWVSSTYGPRINPITGREGMHRGIDLAAPEGSEVYAVKSGTVIDIGEDAVLGKYIMISHEGNWVSLYGHLSAFNTSLNARVQASGLIGKVGSTGQSTGPHLHFELRQNGQNQDPARLLRFFRQSN